MGRLNMQLIGQYDSPFVRRVGIALTLYGQAFEQLPFSTFGEWEKFIAHNPLRRVPALVLDDGEALIESGAILDYLDERAGPERALIAPSGSARRAALKRIALATGVADKAVSFFYTTLFATGIDPAFTARTHAQLRDGFSALDAACAEKIGDWWHGAGPGHDDIAVACVARFVSEAWAEVVNLADYPALQRHCTKAEALPVFKAISQAFIPPR